MTCEHCGAEDVPEHHSCAEMRAFAELAQDLEQEREDLELEAAARVADARAAGELAREELGELEDVEP